MKEVHDTNGTLIGWIVRNYHKIAGTDSYQAYDKEGFVIPTSEGRGWVSTEQEARALLHLAGVELYEDWSIQP